MNKQYKLQVEAINNGTVIDHIPANIGFKVIKLLQLDVSNARITIGLNLPSSALGKKDLIKIENVFISKEQAERLAIFAPNATVNQIEHYEVVAKLPMAMPTEIIDVFLCPNSNCITHDEQAVKSDFSLLDNGADIDLKCKYCEKVFSRDIMQDKE